MPLYIVLHLFSEWQKRLLLQPTLTLRWTLRNLHQPPPPERPGPEEVAGVWRVPPQSRRLDGRPGQGQVVWGTGSVTHNGLIGSYLPFLDVKECLWITTPTLCSGWIRRTNFALCQSQTARISSTLSWGFKRPWQGLRRPSRYIWRCVGRCEIKIEHRTNVH